MAGLMGKYAAFLTRRPVLGNMISSAVSKIRTMGSARRGKSRREMHQEQRASRSSMLSFRFFSRLATLSPSSSLRRKEPTMICPVQRKYHTY